MCEWYRRDYACRCYLIGVAVWCSRYPRTQRRCNVCVSRTEATPEECPHCRPTDAAPVPWEHMIDRSRGNGPTMKWFKAAGHIGVRM